MRREPFRVIERIGIGNIARSRATTVHKRGAQWRLRPRWNRLVLSWRGWGERRGLNPSPQS